MLLKLWALSMKIDVVDTLKYYNLCRIFMFLENIFNLHFSFSLFESQ